MTNYFASDGATYPWYSNTYSAAVFDPNTRKTWVVWEAWTGTKRVQRVRVFNHNTGTWGSTVTIADDGLNGTPPGTPGDDHGDPSLCRDYQGYWHVFFGSHLTASKYYSTSSVDDETTFTARTDINSTAGGVTYPHPVAVGSNIYLFFRQGGAGDADRRLIVFKTSSLSGGVAAWGAEKELITYDPDWAYQGPAINRSGKIHFVITRGDDPLDAFRADVHYCIYDTSDGSLKNATESVSTAAGSLPVDLTTLNTSYRIYTQAGQTGGLPFLTFDRSGNPHVLYCNGNIGGTMAVYHIALFSGSWTSPVQIGTTHSQFSEFAICAGPDDTVQAYLSQYDGVHQDSGDMYTASRSAGVGGTWGSTTLLLAHTTSGPAIGEPQSVLNGLPTARIIFTEVTQGSTDAEAGGLKSYLYGDSGYVGSGGLAPNPPSALPAIYSTMNSH